MMLKRLKVRADIVPEAKTWYLTAGKWYEVQRISHLSFIINDDFGDEILCSFTLCPHLDMHAWEIKEIEDEPA